MEKRFGVVSADGHCRLMHLPFDLWTKRLPRRFQDDGPRVLSGPDGTRQWVVEGRPWSGVGWSGVGRGPVNCYTRAGLAEEPEPGIFRAANARYRCEDMDRDGVDAELVNGPYEQIAMIRNPELRAACVRAVNDWARELYEESQGRFIMLLPLPCQSPDEAVAELRRVAKSGSPPGVIFAWVSAPEPVMHQIWEPVWAAAAETGLPVNLHAYPSGGSRQIGVGGQGLEPRNQSLMRVANFPMGAMAGLMSAVVFSGIRDRHPRVRFVLEEAGGGWGAFVSPGSGARLPGWGFVPEEAGVGGGRSCFGRSARKSNSAGRRGRVSAPKFPLPKNRGPFAPNKTFSRSKSRRKRGSGGYPR